MTSTITTAVGRVLNSGNPTTVPRWSMPMLLDPASCKPLGSVGRRKWFDWPAQKLELEEYGEPISPNDPAIAEQPYFRLDQADGGYLLQPLRAYVRGTYAAQIVGAQAAKPPKAQRPVDLLDGVSLLTGHGAAGRFTIRSVPSILARFKAKGGIEFRSVGDGSDVMVTAPGGALLTSHRDDIALLSPLIVPFILNNGRVDCEVTRHREPVPAVTLAVGLPDAIPWCMECSPK